MSYLFGGINCGLKYPSLKENLGKGSTPFSLAEVGTNLFQSHIFPGESPHYSSFPLHGSSDSLISKDFFQVTAQ